MSARDSHPHPFASHRPPAPQPPGGVRELAWQFLAIVALALGADYLRWRWMQSLNPDALWFAIPLAVAETLAFAGLARTVFQCWATCDPPRQEPPRTPAECGGAGDRPLGVDVVIAVGEEAIERVREVLRSARALSYPSALRLQLHVVDDGAREALERLALQEGARYARALAPHDARVDAAGCGDGDFVVLGDGHTRLFPRLLEHTLGYFRDPRVGCVQTPPWYEDLPQGVPLPQWLQQRLGAFGRWLGEGLQELVGTVRVGHDPFACDPQPWFDLVLRRRNRLGAVRWCGTGAVLRREALLQGDAWRSLLHPSVQSASLAPPDLASALQLRWRMQPAALAWSSFACVWRLAFLLAPIVYGVTGAAPLAGYTSGFYLHAVPFLLALLLAFLAATWGVRAGKAWAFALGLVPQECGRLWRRLRRRFARSASVAREPWVPGRARDDTECRGLQLVVPQVTLIALTLAAIALAAWRVFVQGQGQELPALIVNGAWAVFNLAALLAPVRAALWRPPAAAHAAAAAAAA